MFRLRLSIIATLCILLSACAGGGSSPQPRIDASPTALPPTVSATSTIAVTATHAVTPTRPPFVTATPTPVIVPALPDPATARVVTPRIPYLSGPQASDVNTAREIEHYIYANLPHIQSPPTLCGPEMTHNPGAASFITPDIGWMICGVPATKGIEYKSLFLTHDGGVNWTLVSESGLSGSRKNVPATLPDSGTISNLFFLDESHGWLTVISDSSRVVPEVNFIQSSLFATDDGGRLWRQLDVTIGQYETKAMVFRSPLEGYLAALDPLTRQQIVLATQDGGATWTQPYPAPAPNLLWQFIDAQHGVGAGTILDPAAFLITQDGGATWQQISSLHGQHVRSIISLSFPDSMHGWAIVEYAMPGGRTIALFRTTDGGVTWSEASPNRMADGYFIFCKDAETGYVFDRDGRAVVTHDGGETFQSVGILDQRSSSVATVRAQTGKPALDFELYIYTPYPKPLNTLGWTRIPLGDEVVF